MTSALSGDRASRGRAGFDERADLEERIASDLLTYPEALEIATSELDATSFSHPALRAVFEAAVTAKGNGGDVLGALSIDKQLQVFRLVDRGAPKLRTVDGVRERCARLRELTGAPAPARPATVSAPGEARRRLEPFDVEAALAAPPPPVDWVVEGYVQAGVVTLLHGDGGLGKSLLALLMARGVASGTPILEHSTPKPGRVVIIDGENPGDEIARRLHAFEWDAVAAQLDYIRATASFLDLPDAEAALTEAINGVRLAIIDSQRACWPGDEREAQEVRALYTMLARVAEHTRAAILVLHHDRRTGDYSGSSDLNAAIGARLHLRRDKTNDDYVILAHEKSRSGPRQPAVTYALHRVDQRFAFQIIAGSIIPDTAKTAAEWITDRGTTTSTQEITQRFNVVHRTVQRWVSEGHFSRLGITSRDGNHTPTAQTLPGHAPTRPDVAAEHPPNQPSSTESGRADFDRDTERHDLVSVELAPDTEGCPGPHVVGPGTPTDKAGVADHPETPKRDTPENRPSARDGHDTQKAGFASPLRFEVDS